MSYRPDLDGLRAIAVLLVVGFHLDPAFIPGGHIGVDVFFVISGFLITSILIRKNEEGDFSLFEFYKKRVQRLYPALITCIVVSLIFAYLLMLPQDFKRMGLSASMAALSVSNFLFWSEAGYWDVDSITKPLLHTWTLGVEDQFYLIWPLLVSLISKSKRIIFLSVCITIISLFASLVISEVDISGAFYLLPARVFQFSFGAVLSILIGQGFFCAQSAFRKDLTYLTSLFLIAVSAIFFGPDVEYPGWYSIVPTLGAFLFILAGADTKNSGFLTRGLTFFPLLWIGRISYSLYLTHWPVIVFYRYATDHVLSGFDIAAMLLAMFLLAIALHYLVEIRFHKPRYRSNEASIISSHGSVVKVCAAAGGLACCFGFFVWQTDGMPWRFQNLVFSPDDVAEMKNKRLIDYSKACLISQWGEEENCNDNGKPVMLFFGNSHEPDGYNFIRSGYPEEFKYNMVINFGTLNRCRDLKKNEGRWESEDKDCQFRLDMLFDNGHLNRLKFIVYSAHHTFLPWNEEGLRIIKDIKEINKDVKIILFSDYIETRSPCVRIVNEVQDSSACFKDDNIAYAPFYTKSQELYLAYKGIVDEYIDLMSLLCEGTTPSSCMAATKDGVPYSVDKHHKTRSFSRMAGTIFAEKRPGLFSRQQ